MIRFSVWLISGYAHVLLFVVIERFPGQLKKLWMDNDIKADKLGSGRYWDMECIHCYLFWIISNIYFYS